jgi:hypothetical protein
MRWWTCGFLILMMVAAGIGQAEKLVYVQGARAPLYPTPQLGKAPVAVVGQGTPLAVIAEKGRWYQVRGDRQTGWVVRFMVADHPPAPSPTVPGAAMDALKERARVRPSSYSTTAAARGLRAGDKGLGDAHGADYRQVAEMEGLQPSAEAVADFFRQADDDE